MYKAETMCKTPFDSQGVILDAFKQKIFEETLMARETPTLMAMPF